jgi:hypothetical protein
MPGCGRAKACLCTSPTLTAVAWVCAWCKARASKTVRRSCRPASCRTSGRLGASIVQTLGGVPAGMAPSRLPSQPPPSCSSERKTGPGWPSLVGCIDSATPSLPLLWKPGWISTPSSASWDRPVCGPPDGTCTWPGSLASRRRHLWHCGMLRALRTAHPCVPGLTPGTRPRSGVRSRTSCAPMAPPPSNSIPCRAASAG